MRKLTKNSEIIVTIESYSSSGQGIARVGGYVIFVKGALHGEVCKIRILKAQKNAAYAKIAELIAPSEHRTMPVCQNFGKCGGCDFLHMDYEEELRFKRLRVEDALRRIGGFDITVPPVCGSESISAYRNKSIFAVGHGSDGAFAGFYRERSHDIVPAGHCVIQADVSRRAASAVTDWMTLYKIPAYDEKTGTGAIRHIFSRSAFETGEAQVTIVTADETAEHLEKLCDMILKRCPETSSIVLNINKTRGNTVLAGEFRTIWGDGFITDKLCSHSFRLSPRSFYQINRAQAERLYDKAVSLAALTKNDTALDLYCGIGTITLLLARSAGLVIGAEIIPEAVSDAQNNAALNGVTNARFICADASDAAAMLKKDGLSPAAVVVDPPRKGLSPDVIDTISKMSPGRVVYVSCDPATLARDLRLFSGNGFMPKDVFPYDMFPRCAHVETVALLERICQTNYS